MVLKRSEIEAEIEWVKDLLREYCIKLPDIAYWKVDDWRSNREQLDIIRKTCLGWDITDYGSGDYRNIGNVAFTIRNGYLKDPKIGTPYAEKALIFRDGQSLPLHFHFTKIEDIINKAGGVLWLKLYNSNEDNSLDETSNVTVEMDEIIHTFKAGEIIRVMPGNSITLRPRTYHAFGSEAGKGDLICGEVSSVNDDNVDNYFLGQGARYPKIEEDVPIKIPLCNEYGKILAD